MNTHNRKKPLLFRTFTSYLDIVLGNNYRLAALHQWSFPRDAEHALNLEISENESRKDFSKSERIEYARRLERIEAAKERKIATQNNDAARADCENFRTLIQKGRACDLVAEKLSIGSGRQYEKEKYIVDNKEKLSIEDFAEWDEGKLSTNKAYQKIKQENTRLKEQLWKIFPLRFNVISKHMSRFDLADYSPFCMLQNNDAARAATKNFSGLKSR